MQEVLDKFKFRNQIPTLVEADALGFLMEKFLDSSINLSPKPVLNGDDSVRLEGLDNHGMGTVFEELIRRFNEENNEEAGSTLRRGMWCNSWRASSSCPSPTRLGPVRTWSTTAPAEPAGC